MLQEQAGAQGKRGMDDVCRSVTKRYERYKLSVLGPLLGSSEKFIMSARPTEFLAPNGPVSLGLALAKPD